MENLSESSWDLDRLVDRSKRATGVRLPSSFARGSGGQPVLSKLIQGGRGGAVRLKLYLSIVLLAGSKSTHRLHGANTIVDVSGPTWARVLALPDPSSAGARRIADAQNQLARMRLLSVDRLAGRTPKLTLLHPSGTGQPWVEPGTPYIRVPLEIWTRRWIWLLSAKELAVYVAILDLCGGRGRDGTGGPQALSGTALNRYGMSEDTWRIASASLEEFGLIVSDREVVRVGLETPRLRKRYQLLPEALQIDAPLSP